jgi:uncharacterized protein
MQGAKLLGPAIIAATMYGLLPAHAASPSFDCTKAESAAEMLVCQDEELAKLDREIARLFTLANNGSRIAPNRRAELIGSQRGWIKWRDSCWKEQEVRACLYSTYVTRIHQIREGYAEARRPDPSAISSGPMLVDCANFATSIRATFVKLQTPMAYLESGTAYRIVMTLTPAASGTPTASRTPAASRPPAPSGAKYTAQYGSGEAALWEKGREATLQLPGRAQLNCRLRDSG